MRLLQAIKGKDHGGAEGFFNRLSQGFMPFVSQKLLVPPSKIPLSPELNPFIERVSFGGPFDLSSRVLFFEAIRRWRPHVVLTWMNRATHFCPGSFERRFLPPFAHVARLGGFYDLKYYKSCDALIGNTRGIVSYFIDQGWPKERAFYIPNFVTLPKETSTFSREAYGIDQKTCLLVAAGRLHMNKAFDTLIKALASLPSFHLLLLGEGPEQKNLETLATALGVRSQIHFLGWQSNPSPFYYGADLFICPSRHEPLGNVLLDAWAHHRPLIAARSQGPSEYIQDGITGHLFPIDDHDALASAIKLLWENPSLRHSMVEKGFSFLQKTFSQEAVVSQYRTLFEQFTDPYFQNRSIPKSVIP